MSETRRDFLKILGAGAAAATTPAATATPAARPQGRARLDYPAQPIAGAPALAPGASLDFSYPDAASPCVLIRSREPVAGGLGPRRDLVAFSVLCPHMGCPLRFDAAQNVFKCPCHFSRYDAEKHGQMIIGQATRNLARIALRYDDATGGVTAVGVDGLIWGRQANVLD